MDNKDYQKQRYIGHWGGKEEQENQKHPSKEHFNLKDEG